MTRQLPILNLALTLAVVGLGMQLAWNWEAFDKQKNVRLLLSDSQAPPDTRALPLDLDVPSIFLDYRLIAEKNLFAEERRPPRPGDGGSPVITASPPSPMPILHNILIIGERRVATLTTFDGTAGFRNQGSKVRASIGDAVQSYTVSEITEDAIVLKYNDSEWVIEKEQGAPPKASDGTAAQGVKIVRIGAPGSAVEATSPTK